MSALIRWTFPLVAYLCVGTVISALLGYGYLRHNGTLDDDKLFRIMALLHGLNVDEMNKEGQAAVEEVPVEELSFADQQRQVQAATLHFDAKQKQLADSLAGFNDQLKRVSEATVQYGQLQKVVEIFLKEQRDAFANSDLAEVRKHLEDIQPKKQAKPLLIEYITGGEINTAILLLGTMKDRSRREILRTFDQPEDIKMLYELETHMLNDNPAKKLINDKLDELKKLQAQEKK